MNDIEVGEYVRVKNVRGNVIAKIIKYLGRDGGYKGSKMYLLDRYVRHTWDCIASDKIYESDITKHSKNIIDVLEVGDIVDISSEQLIQGRVTISLTTQKILEDFKVDLADNLMKLNSILTHEQYESNAYRLEE